MGKRARSRCPGWPHYMHEKLVEMGRDGDKDGATYHVTLDGNVKAPFSRK